MNQVIITRSSETVRGARRTTLAQKISVGQNTLVMVLIILITIVSLLYLVHQNSSATKGYALKVLEYEYDELLQKNEVWNMRIATEKSLRTITESPVINGMVDAGDPTYINPVSE